MDNSSQAVRCINHKYIVVEWSQQDMSGTLKKISPKSNSETNSCGYDNRIITKKAIEYYEKMLIMAEKETQTIKKYIREQAEEPRKEDSRSTDL